MKDRGSGWCGIVAGLLALLGVLEVAGGAEARRVRLSSADEVVEIVAAVRHTTVIALPSEERILDFVAGDTESWALTGEANVAYVKPFAEGVQTNVALVTASGRIFAFLCREGGSEPDLVVHVEVGDPDGERERPIGSPLHEPAFVAASEVSDYREAALAAQERVRATQDTAVATVQREVEAFRTAYPRQMRFEYRLNERAQRDPFSVVAMWNDGRHTYVRSTAPESPALYESRDGQPSLVEYELTEDGLYVAQRVLRDGWLQIGKRRAHWVWVPAREPAGGME